MALRLCNKSVKTEFKYISNLLRKMRNTSKSHGRKEIWNKNNVSVLSETVEHSKEILYNVWQHNVTSGNN